MSSSKEVMNIKNANLKSLLKKVKSFTKDGKLDLSSSEDLSIAVMNLISIEEHLFFTSQKTGKKEYLDILNEVRVMRTELLKEIIKDYEGEVWCVSKHLLAASMRIMEVGTKELRKSNKKKAWELFEKSYNLYSLFWGINLKVVDTKDLRLKTKSTNEIKFINEKDPPAGGEQAKESVFSKLGALVQKAIDCCKE